MDRAAAELFAQGLSTRTRSTYSSAKKRYLSFCQRAGLTPLPVSERSLILFVTFLAREGLRPQSISGYLSAIRHLEVEVGGSSTPRGIWPRLHYTLKGVSRSMVNTPTLTRLPVTPAILRLLKTQWESGRVDHFLARLFWAVACTAFFGCFRLGELLATVPGAPHGVLVKDVVFEWRASPPRASLLLRLSKTNQVGPGTPVILGATGQDLCPVIALHNFLSVRQAGSGPLFTCQDGSPLAKDVFVRAVRLALLQAGVDCSKYSGHSFRIGAATAAAQAGVSPDKIKLLGRWSSEAYMVYIKTPPGDIAAMSSLLVASTRGLP